MNEDGGVMEREESGINEEASEGEDDGKDTATWLDRSDDEVPIGRKQLVCFNVDEQRPYFSLGMTFSNATRVGESITGMLYLEEFP